MGVIKITTVRYAISEEALREHYTKVLLGTRGVALPDEAEFEIEFEEDEVVGIAFVWEDEEEL